MLDDIDLSFPRGSFTLLTGANGAGKTTLLRLLSTYAVPSAGTIHWVEADGSEIRDPAKVRSHTGYAGHAPLSWDELTVRENLAVQLRLRSLPTDMLDDTLDRFDLQARADDRADTLSRGMRQRLALAMATVHRPAFLLLDEPLSNLDDASMQRLLTLLAEFRGRSTTVVATHDPERLRPLADNEVLLAQGRPQTPGGRP